VLNWRAIENISISKNGLHIWLYLLPTHVKTNMKGLHTDLEMWNRINLIYCQADHSKPIYEIRIVSKEIRGFFLDTHFRKLIFFFLIIITCGIENYWTSFFRVVYPNMNNKITWTLELEDVNENTNVKSWQNDLHSKSASPNTIRRVLWITWILIEEVLIRIFSSRSLNHKILCRIKRFHDDSGAYWSNYLKREQRNTCTYHLI
jgi:hypothetical protein